MNDEQINAAIDAIMDYPYIVRGCDLCRDDNFCRNNYCKDLNAMHEAEKTLSETNMFVMAHYIEQLVNKNGLFYFRATARQRAEAFLRTLGKWDQSGDATEMVKEGHK